MISLAEHPPAPRGETAQLSMSSGSDHIKSQKGPSCGISHTLSIMRTWSSVRTSGDRPPCTHSTLPSMTACGLVKRRPDRKDKNETEATHTTMVQDKQDEPKLGSEVVKVNLALPQSTLQLCTAFL